MTTKLPPPPKGTTAPPPPPPGTNAPLTPDQVKAQLLGTASPGPVGNPMVDGHGALNAYAAVSQPGLQLTQTAPTVATPIGSTVDLNQTWLGSFWHGSS